MLPMVLSAHALDHISDDDTNPCEQCDFLAESYELDFISTTNSFVEIEPCLVPNSFVLFTSYQISKETIVLPEFVYNKPPPKH